MSIAIIYGSAVINNQPIMDLSATARSGSGVHMTIRVDRDFYIVLISILTVNIMVSKAVIKQWFNLLLNSPSNYSLVYRYISIIIVADIQSTFNKITLIVHSFNINIYWFVLNQLIFWFV